MAIDKKEIATFRDLIGQDDVVSVRQGIDRMREIDDPELRATMASGLDVNEEGRVVIGRDSEVAKRVRAAHREEVALWALRWAGKLERTTVLVLVGIDDMPDFEVLAGLTQLKRLRIPSLHPAGAASLATLPGLETLDIGLCQSMVSFEPIAALTGLREVCLGYTKLADLRGVDKLKELRKLTVWDHALADLSDLGNHPTLEELVLWRSPRSMAGLPTVRSLRTLGLGGTGSKANLGRIARIPGLETLQLFSPKRAELSALAGSASLRTLIVTESSLTSLDGLTDLPALRTVKLEKCKELSDISGLAGVPALEDLVLTGCAALSRIDVVAGLGALQSLDLRECTAMPWWIAQREYGATGLAQLREQLRDGEASAARVAADPSRRRTELALVRRLLKSAKAEEVGRGLEFAIALDDAALWESLADGAYIANGPRDARKPESGAWYEAGEVVGGRGAGARVRAGFRDTVAAWALRKSGRLQDVRFLRLPVALLPIVEGLVNLEDLVISHSDALANVDALRSLVGLRGLCLEDQGYGELANIDGLSGLTRLERLTLPARLTTDIRALGSLTSLRVLSLRCMADDISALGHCTALEQLELRCRAPNLDAIAACRELRQLDISECSHLQQVHALGALTKLEDLRYDRCPCIDRGRRGWLGKAELAEVLPYLRSAT